MSEMPCTEACRQMLQGTHHCTHCEKESIAMYAAIQRVRHLHSPVVSADDIVCQYCIDGSGIEIANVTYPCETIELLDRT